MGYLDDAKPKGMSKKKVGAAAEIDRSASSSKRNPWESALVKAFGNQMVVGCMMLSSIQVQYLNDCIKPIQTSKYGES